MASYNELLALIDAYINRNGVQAITGQILNGVLKAMVDQLGRGYTLMGYAEPTGDPGTPDGPESWFASVPGTYTNYGEIQVAAGELALLSFAPSEGWTKNTIYEGFREVTATADDNIGFPQVGVTYANGVLSFDFKNIKGEPGENGQDGDPAGFGAVTASVDDQVGTPSVSVSSSGPDTAKVFSFAFHNLKGETGVTSVLATVDNTSGNPQCSVSLQGGQLTLAFTGLKGAQGNTGSSVDYPFTIVNNLTTDDPTQALSAAQGVVLAGQVSQLEHKVDGGNSEIFSTLVFEQGAISTANGSDQSSMTQVRSNFVVTPSLRVTVTNGSVYVYGWNGDTYLSAVGWKTGTNDFEIAGATKYKLVFKLPSGNLTPAGVGDLGASVYVPVRGEVVKCVSQTLNDTEKQTARGNIGAASEEYVGGNSLEEEINLSSYQDEMYYITSGGSWALNSGQGRSKYVDILPGVKYRLVNNKSDESYYAFLHSLTGRNTTGVVDYATGYSGRTPLASGQSVDIIAPDNAKYLYILKSYTGGTDVLPNMYEIKKTITQRVEDLENREQGGADLARIFESIPMPIDANGYEIPLTFGMNAALKKAAQGNQIKYVAKKAYPTLDSPTGAAAGEKTGFPYSSVKEMAKFIHWHVSERTFMTAINNEYGLFYTEDVASNNSRSDYGYTYHGVNCGPYYGMVCNIFALWCLGYPVPFDTAQFAYLASKGVLVRLNNQTAQTVHICDLVWYQGHTALVTTVKHDEYGNVTEVNITESLGHVKTTTFTAEQFETYLHITHEAILYRPTFVYKNTYQPSEFIGVRGEATPSAYEYNDDICFFAGDYAAWKYGEDAWVNYTKGSYTGMKIYKDGTLVDTIALDADSTVHKVEVTSYISGTGKYKACLTDGANDSDFTYWQMVEATASYSSGVVSFESANGTPWYIQVCSSNGSAYCWYEITQDEINDGEATLDLSAMVAEQYGTVFGTQYVRVAFKAEYGGVVSDMIQL